jgi:hypothetical protein
MAAVAPMPRASESSVVAVKQGYEGTIGRRSAGQPDVSDFLARLGDATL